MSSDYQGIINLFHNLSGGEIDDRINSDDIDSFFQTLTDVYVTMLDTGPLSIKADSIQFKNKTNRLLSCYTPTRRSYRWNERCSK